MVGKGDRFRLELASGGGFGDPAERPLDAIERDIRDGYVSETRAERVFLRGRVPAGQVSG